MFAGLSATSLRVLSSQFFQKFFCYFKKIKERVMIILKSVNVKSLFIYTLYNKLQMKNASMVCF